VADLEAELVAPKMIQSEEEVTLTFKLNHDGQPISDLQPYLGEKGHLVIIRQATPLTRADYVHAHALRSTADSDVSFRTQFPQSGTYKLWGQFNHAGEIAVFDFWVKVL
jgi:hypothetical protein